MALNNFIRFNSNVDVNFIKSDNDISKNFAEALSLKNKLQDSTVMHTNFNTFDIDVYYTPEGTTSKNSHLSFYKRTPSLKYYEYVCSITNGVYSISDYNILSNENYHYLVAIERKVKDEITRKVIPEYVLYENNDDLGRNCFYNVGFSGWSICDIEETEVEGIYTKTGTTWNLGLGLGEENGTQNLSVTSWDTLNRFPKVSVGNKNYDSMSFTGLLGRMIEYNKYNFVGETNEYLTEPNFIYQYTEKEDTYIPGAGYPCDRKISNPYNRETDKLNSWKKFASNGNLKFIRDDKGNGWIALISDSTEYNINRASNLKQTAITFNWKEVVDSSLISIIIENEEKLEEKDELLTIADVPNNVVIRKYIGSIVNNGYSFPANVTMSGRDSGIELGSYVAQYTPNFGYCWSNQSTQTAQVEMKICTSVGNKPSNLRPSVIYNGLEFTNGFNKPAHVTMTGNDRGTNFGVYTATYTPEEGYCWEDETTNSVTVNLIISRASVGDKPSELYPVSQYTGSEITNGYTCPAHVTMTGSDRGTELGNYVATYTPNENYCWSDGEIESVTIIFTIKRAIAGNKPEPSISAYYTGSEITNGYTCPAHVTMTGSDRGTIPGTYTAIYTLDANYCWSDESYDTATSSLTINVTPVGDKPTNLYVNHYYRGSEITNGYTCPAHVTMTGSDRGTEIGTYTAIYTPEEYYCWSDETYDAIMVELEIKEYPGLTFTANNSRSVIGFNANGYISGIDIKSSTDGENWTTVIPGSTRITLEHVGDKVYFKGNNPNGINTAASTSSETFYYFSTTKSVSASGNIMSLIDNGACNTTMMPSEYCFYNLFLLCESLTTAPTLPATELTENCYASMFRNCTALTTTPALPATTLANGCYDSMFRNCTSLTSAPELPATELAQSCYARMFMNTSLTTTPVLPATTLANWCYNAMFASSSLTTPPALPATELAESCYCLMFSGCTSLTTPPALPATTLFNGCYLNMFSGCTSLIVSDTQTSEAQYAWRIPVAEVFSNTLIQRWMFLNCLGTRSSDDMAGEQGQSYTYYTQNEPVPEPNYLCFTANTAGSTIAMKIKGTPTLNQNFQYSTDRINWSTFTPKSTIITLANVGDKVYFKGNNPNGVSETISIYYYFVMTGSIAASGNIMSLIDNGVCMTTVIPNNYCYVYMFRNCTSLTTPPALPATELTESCYQYMFYGCTSLTTVPELPATELANYCYGEMFYGCKSLTTVPELPATTLANLCYSEMFYGCTSLTTAPELPATTLADKCYFKMFFGCTNLTTAPALPATELIDSCYACMFSGCINLTTAPVLPATELADGCYNSMFSACTNLTTPPALPATELADGCYQYMFQTCKSLTTAPVLLATTLTKYCYALMFSGCTNLTTAPVLPATELADGCYRLMFENCSSLTTPPALPATTLGGYSYYGMFYGCTSLTTAPALPATTLANYCYLSMFSGCKSLTSAPASLPATVLADWCYSDMFSACTSLTTAPTLPATILADYCYDGMFSGCKSLTSAPELPATELGEGCYDSMFRNCTSLTSAPELPATVLTNYCYKQMFEGCISLTTAPALPALSGRTQCYLYMFQNCYSLETVPALPMITLGVRCYLGMFNGCGLLAVSDTSGAGYDKVWRMPTAGTFTNTYIQSGMFTSCEGTRSSNDMAGEQGQSYTYYTQNEPIFKPSPLCFKANEAGSTVSMLVSGTPTLSQNFQSSTDGINWTEFVPGTTTITLTNVGDKVYFKGNNSNGVNESSSNFYHFTMTGSIAASGNIMSLIDDGLCMCVVIPNNYCFYSMFINCTNLTTPPALPATTLTDYCYASMFDGCKSLTTAPALPATELVQSCYLKMFQTCTSLTTAPTLSATTLAKSCYQNMFFGCTLLTYIPELPATTLAENCYYGMFWNCTSLIVSDTSGSGYLNTWVIPKNGVGSGNYVMYMMFYNCAGTTSSAQQVNFNGVQKTYYTQNAPIS